MFAGSLEITVVVEAVLRVDARHALLITTVAAVTILLERLRNFVVIEQLLQPLFHLRTPMDRAVELVERQGILAEDLSCIGL